MEESIKKYHQAAFSYVGLGVVIVLLTSIFIPSNHYRSGFGPLLAGIAVLLVISYFIYKGTSWLAKLLCVLALGRTAWWSYSFFAFGDEATSWVYLLNAIINVIILFMLARAAWYFVGKSDNTNPLKEASV